ncbi:hypothetical protein LJR289_000566 [Pseudoduganella sp. LjRoot289]|uniref:hypothetical protein n=1 Tax=Pseudoduganella sp. LjRoot289 TaxID=3342314 RepID=UPI003ECCBCE9
MDKPKPTQRPDLLSAPQGSSSSSSQRILASLENSGKSNAPGATLARLRPSHLVLLVTLLAVLAAIVACFSYVGMEPAQHRKELDFGKHPTPLARPPQEVERMAAAIVNEPLPAVSPASSKLSSNQHRAAAAAVAAAAAAQPAGAARIAQRRTAARLHAPDTPAKAAPGMPATQAREWGHAHANASASPSASARPLAAAYAGGTVPQARLSAAAAQPDSDIALLTALVAHTGAQASSPPTGQASRDVVEHKEGDSTATLLRRCQRLGGAEASLCRTRICNGLWLHEAACRTPVED